MGFLHSRYLTGILVHKNERCVIRESKARCRADCIPAGLVRAASVVVVYQRKRRLALVVGLNAVQDWRAHEVRTVKVHLDDCAEIEIWCIRTKNRTLSVCFLQCCDCKFP